MIKVFLREKKLKNGKKGLYLDFYPPVLNPETKKQTRREHLRLYVFEKPKSEIEREHNKETKMLGENIRSQRQLELQAGAYGFVSARNKQKDFIEFFRKICESKKQTSKSNYDFWLSILKHLTDFTGGTLRCGDVTESFCIEFKDYLRHKAGLAQNSASAYFSSFKTAVNTAFKQKLLSVNPVENIKSIEPEESEREFLTLAELKKLAAADFKYDDLKRAALFSALTGLRFSDIEKLTWGEIQHSREQDFYIRFRQKKTGGAETLPISNDARELLGEAGTQAEEVFKNLQYWHCVYLSDWTAKAGIERRITFHAFRHSFATLQLTLGTDIYTVSKLLGHRNLATTQIYAKIIDEKKREAANKIKLK